MGLKRCSLVGLKRSMPCHDLVKVERSSSSSSRKKKKKSKYGYHRLTSRDDYDNRISSSASLSKPKRLRMTTSRGEGGSSDPYSYGATTIDMWALLNPASAALETRDFDVIFPSTTTKVMMDMESDVLFVLPSPEPPLLVVDIDTSLPTTTTANSTSLALPKALLQTTPARSSPPTTTSNTSTTRKAASVVPKYDSNSGNSLVKTKSPCLVGDVARELALARIAGYSSSR